MSAKHKANPTVNKILLQIFVDREQGKFTETQVEKSGDTLKSQMNIEYWMNMEYKNARRIN